MTDRKIIEKTWYILLGAVITAEQYSDGGTQFFTEGWDGSRRFFTDIKWLNEEGEVVTEDEAQAELARIKERIATRQKADSEPTSPAGDA